MNRELLNDLLTLKQRDLDTRSRLLREGKLYGNYAEEMQQVHRENAKALDDIVSAYGWPGISVAGPEGSQAAWLVAQHSICTPELQKKFLFFLARAAESGDATKAQVAFLTDRIRFNEGRPQLYGTVLDWNEDGELCCEIEDIAGVDARRQAVGLAPFQEDLEKHRREVFAEGGRPPSDLTQHKKDGRAWAKSIGWR